MDSKPQQAGPLNLHRGENRHCWSGSRRKARRKEPWVLQTHQELQQYLELGFSCCLLLGHQVYLWEQEAHPGCDSG